MKMWWDNLPNPTLVETAWERQMNVSGIETYENSRRIVGKDGKERLQAATDTGAGQKFLRKLLKDAQGGIQKLQGEMLARGTQRTPLSLKATVLVVPADTLALLCLKPMIDKTYTASQPDIGVGYQSICVDVASAVETELNFRHWVKSSREATEAYAKEGGLDKIPKSRAEFLIAESGMSRASMIRWKKAFKELSEYKWKANEKHYCGDALITSVSKVLPEYFQIHHFQAKGKNQKFLRMTDSFRNTFNDMEYNIASMQTIKKPMLTKPKRWVEA